MAEEPELSSKDRREALNFAERIAELAASAPDRQTKTELYRAVNSLRRRAGFSEQQKLEEVFVAIESGAQTVTDIVRETSFPPQKVEWALKLLETGGLIEMQRISLTGLGRPALLIKLIGSRASN